MSRRAQENLVGVIVLAVFVVMLYLTFGYSSRARLVPLPVCIFGIILAVAQLFWQNLRPTDELRVNFLDVVGRGTINSPVVGSQSGSASAQPQSTEADGERKPAGELSAFGIIAILLALVFVVGPLPSVFLFTAGYLALTRHCSPARAILYAFLCAAILYGLFGFALGVQLNRGLLSGFISSFVDF
ncbi:MAG TPA: tripartite tricarboxylate transporter TctB family protein [Aestuariivirgaceae bacterium]|nr:tripartite tricarboxylate transporter TctB family protein [Aestuariivirgaceae bacterium]